MAALLLLPLPAMAEPGAAGWRVTPRIEHSDVVINGRDAQWRSAGVTVGRVTAITLDGKTFQGVVTMDIERAFQFPKDSAAKILTSGLLGDQYIGIEPGGDPENIAAGAVITQTQSAVILENLIGQFLFNKAAEGKPADESQ